MKAWGALQALAVLALLAAAGCTDNAEPSTLDRQAPTRESTPVGADMLPVPANVTILPPTDPSFDVPFAADGCQGTEVVINVAASLLAQYLAPGFESGDPHQLLGVPVESGRGAVALTLHRCAEAGLSDGGPLSLATLAILVAPPTVPGERPQAAEDWYIVAMLVDRGDLHQLALAARAPAAGGEGAVELLGVPGAGARAHAVARDGADEAFTIDAAASAPLAEDGMLRRYWHSHTRGTSWLDVATTGTMLKGLATCSMRAGTVWADVPRSSICTVEGEWLARAWEPSTWAARYTYAWTVLPATA